jgi:quercetin dioxygenase-like cupin family protein
MNQSLPPYPRVLLRSEESDGRISVIVSLMPAGAGGPPLHKHDFDEAVYVLDGELTFQVGGDLLTARTGALMFAPGGVAHTFANRSESPALFLITCTPAGFEREFARRAARTAGIDPPDWALKDIPPVTALGPRLGEQH